MSSKRSYPRRLIEVDLPIKQISVHARREKSIRHGHISTLHIWWARRPLAACRAVLCAALWPDPADDLCPQDFRDRAAAALTAFARKAAASESLSTHCSGHALGRWLSLTKPEGELDTTNPTHLVWLRESLLDFIADFANWDNSTVPEYLETARALTQAAHEALGGEPGTRPLVVDPFAGGGSIPLEALRVGADAFASDLNPVAVLLNKVVLEYIPRYGQQLADEVRRWGAWIKEQAEQELAEFYPKDEDGATPIAYLWARTITCEGPGCGAEVPLMRSLWLAKKGSRSVALKLNPDRQANRVDFEIINNPKTKEVGEGTVRRGSATCPVCGYTTPVASVRAQLRARRGGTADARLFCVVTTRPGQQGRFYRLPTQRDLDAIRRAEEELERREVAHPGPLSLVPDEPLPPQGTLGFRVQLYGMEQWCDLFIPRQLLALTTLARLVRETGGRLTAEHDSGFAATIQTCLALMVDKLADSNSGQVWWMTSGEKTVGTFTRQTVQMVWDFSEVPLSDAPSRNISAAVEWIERVIEHILEVVPLSAVGQAMQSDACENGLPDDAIHALVSDPPYYDAVPYADLSDFFIVWLKRTLPASMSAAFADTTTVKAEECILDEVKGKDRVYFEQKMTWALSDGRRALSPSGIGVFVFAHKTTSGWEAMLQGLLTSGWTITGTWPIDTERQAKVNTINRAFLASSIHLVCRPREDASGRVVEIVGDWRDVLAELPRRIHDWLPRLACEGVVGADAIFACLGPALEIFSRYSRVEKANSEHVTLHEYLEYVWAAVAREALTAIFEGADSSGFEEDARLTAIWFWVLKAAAQNGNNGQAPSEDEETGNDTEEQESPQGKKKAQGYAMEYDAARKLAQGLGADMGRLSRPGGIITISGSVATLNGITSRESHLIGQQLSLFQDEIPAQMKRTKSQKSPSITLQDIQTRQPRLFDDQPDLRVVNPEQPTLPQFEQTSTLRPLMHRLLDSGVTVLDRLHQAMLLFGRSQTALLGQFLTETRMGTDTRFWRLANALSALYPPDSEEKRWVDGVLGRKKGLGF